MIKIENTQVMNWEAAIRGMRKATITFMKFIDTLPMLRSCGK